MNFQGFFVLDSYWIFALAFNLFREHTAEVFFAGFYLVFPAKTKNKKQWPKNVVSVFCSKQKQKNQLNSCFMGRAVFFQYIEGHMQKFRHFWAQKKMNRKVTWDVFPLRSFSYTVCIGKWHHSVNVSLWMRPVCGHSHKCSY